MGSNVTLHRQISKGHAYWVIRWTTTDGRRPGKTIGRADLMSKRFAARFSRSLRRELLRLGAAFGQQAGHPSAPLLASGLTVQTRISIVERGRQAGRVNIPGWLLNTVLRELRDGYAVWVFRT